MDKLISSPDTASPHGLWAASAGAAPATAALDRAVSTNVAIIGGGYAGLSAALHLALQGVEVLLLEAFEIGHGGAGRNVGLVNAGLWVMPDAVIAAMGPARGESLLALLGDAPEQVFALIERYGIPCQKVRNGTLHCAVGHKGMKEIEQRAAQWQKRGAPVAILDAKEASRKIGSNAYQGALLDHRAGTIQPLAYARGLAEAAIREGAIIYTQSAVRDAKPHNDGWRLQTDLGHVDARRVIVAGDIYTTGPWSILREQQIPLPYFNIATKPLPLAQRHRILPERQGAWDTCRILSSFRFDGDGRLVFGSVGALNGRGAATHRAWVARKLRQLFPEIGNVEFEHEWWGMIGMTTDNMPRFHRLADNVVAIAGYNGRGIGPGTVFGQCLAGLMTGKISEAELPLPITRPSLPRWRRTRQAFYESGARCWHMISALDSRIR